MEKLSYEQHNTEHGVLTETVPYDKGGFYIDTHVSQWAGGPERLLYRARWPSNNGYYLVTEWRSQKFDVLWKMLQFLNDDK